MMKYIKYDIWIAKVDFAEVKGYKVRPVLVIDANNVFILSVKITSHSPRKEDPLYYEIVHWKESGLQKQSTLRIGQKLQIPESNFYKKIGHLHSDDIKNVDDMIRQSMN